MERITELLRRKRLAAQELARPIPTMTDEEQAEIFNLAFAAETRLARQLKAEQDARLQVADIRQRINDGVYDSPAVIDSTAEIVARVIL